jgi:hypothetical protein
MHHLEVSDQEKKQARHPHEIFLINLIFNHILLFAAALGVATSYPFMLLPIPTVSAGILIYILWRARSSLNTAPWYVQCHWQIAARRSRLFLLLLGVVVAIVIALFLLAGGHPRPQHWALLGAVVLPTMVTILALVIMETESMQQATHGQVPAWIADRVPQAATEAASA